MMKGYVYHQPIAERPAQLHCQNTAMCLPNLHHSFYVLVFLYNIFEQAHLGIQSFSLLCKHNASKPSSVYPQ